MPFLECLTCESHIGPNEFNDKKHLRLWEELIDIDGIEESIGWHGCYQHVCTNKDVKKKFNDMGVNI